MDDISIALASHGVFQRCANVRQTPPNKREPFRTQARTGSNAFLRCCPRTKMLALDQSPFALDQRPTRAHSILIKCCCPEDLGLEAPARTASRIAPRLVSAVRSNNRHKPLNLRIFLADREGFEPSNGFHRYTLSRRAPSTTRPPVHAWEGGDTRPGVIR